MSLHAVDNRSQAQASSHCYLHKALMCSWFFIVGCWINFRIGLWGSRYSYRSQWSLLWAYHYVDTTYEGWIDGRFTFVHKGFCVIMQSCIKDSEQGLCIGLIDCLDDSVWLIN